MMAGSVWNAVARRHAEWRSDYIVLKYLRQLRGDNARLRAELESVKPGPYSHSGRMASANLIRGLALGLGLWFSILWWKQSGHSEALREEVREALVAARHG